MSILDTTELHPSKWLRWLKRKRLWLPSQPLSLPLGMLTLWLWSSFRSSAAMLGRPSGILWRDPHGGEERPANNHLCELGGESSEDCQHVNKFESGSLTPKWSLPVKLQLWKTA